MGDMMNLDLSAGAIPDEVKVIVQLLIEGRIKQLIVIAEIEDGKFLDGVFIQQPNDCNRYAMIGALDVSKRDYMRMEIQSRVPYLEPGMDDDT
jgi:hypothetical protein